MPAPGQIFIAYAKEDRAAAKEICTALENAGLSCWMSARDIAAGAARKRAISDAIAASRAMLVIVSSHTSGSKRLLREIERGIDRGLTLLPVRVEEVLPEGELDRLLGAASWVDAPSGPTSLVVGRIATSVLASARPAPPPAPAPTAWSEPEREAAPEPEPETTTPLPPALLEQEAAQSAPREIARARPMTTRVRPAPAPAPAPSADPAKRQPVMLILAGVAVLIIIVAVMSRGDRQSAEPAAPSPAAGSAGQGDAAIVAASLPALEARASLGPATRAVRAAAAAYAPERRVDTVMTVSFVDDGIEWALQVVPGERFVIFTASSTNTVAYVAEITYPASQLELRAALSGAPPAVAMRPIDPSAAAADYAQLLARWAAYVRELR